MLSLKKLHGNGRSAYEVLCDLPDHVIKSRRFDYSGADDLGAHANAIRFAKAAETVPVFRAFLFSDDDGAGKDQRIKVRSYVCMREKLLTGVRYAVAMCRMDSGELRSISFLRGTSGDEESQALGKAEQFLRGVVFENWRKQGAKDSLLKSREPSAGNSGKERALKHPNSFVEKDQGEKVDCKCGKNRSHGLMMACERCGVWEHAECQGYRNKKQIPAEYICSACVRAEREEVIIIRCEEQGKSWSMSSGDTRAGVICREQEDRVSVCCICGCEDNEYYEALIQPCSCAGCSLLAHSSCITTVKVGGSQKEQRLQRSGVCCFCGSSVKDSVGNETKSQKGGRWVEEAPDTGNTKLGKGDQVSVARKRLRSASSGSAVSVKAAHGEKLSSKNSRNEKGSSLVHPDKVQTEVSPTESKKGSSPFLGRRFSDAAANVPIKKRRIQLEMARSPSPPRGSVTLGPGTAAVHEVLDVTKPSGSQISEDVHATVTIKSDGKGRGSLEPSAAAQAQVLDSEAPSAALKISEEDLEKGDSQMSPLVTALETNAAGGIVIGGRPQLGQLDLVVGCKSEKRDGESQQRKENRCVMENGTTPASNRRKEASSLVSQVDGQPQVLPVQAGNIGPTREGEQSCVVESVFMSEHLLSSAPSKVGHAGGQSEEVLSDLSREGGTVLSPNSKRKFSETDMSHTVRDHLEESSRSRPGNRAGNLSFQTSIVGSTAGDHVHKLAPRDSEFMKSLAPVGKNSSLRDDRLHWDLNMDMEEWERPSEEDNAVPSTQKLSSVPITGEEKTESLHKKNLDEGSQEDELSAAVNASTIDEDGRFEQERPPQDSADASRKFNAAEVSDDSLKTEMQVESKDGISLMPSRSCNASLKLAEGQLRDTILSVSSEGIIGTDISKQHDFTEDGPEVDRSSLQGGKSISALQKDNLRTELEIAPAPDQEAEVHSEEPPSVVGPIVDKETKGRVFLVAEKGQLDLDIRGSELTDIKADTSCEHEEGDICGTNSVKGLTDNCSEAAGVLQAGKKPESYGESLSHPVHSEGDVVSTHEPTSVVPVAELNSIGKDTELRGLDDAEGASHEDEKLVDKKVVEEVITDRNRSSTSPSRQPASLKWEGDNGEDLEAENVDYGDSDLREGDDHDMEDRVQRGASEVESSWNPYGEMKISEVQGASASQAHKGDADDISNVMGTRTRRYGGETTGAEEFQGMDLKRAHAVRVDDPKCASILGRSSTSTEMNGDLVVEEGKVGDEHGNGSASFATSDSHRTSLERTEDLIGTARSGRKSEIWRERSEGGSRVRTKSGWDQLPEGFQSAEEALQAARSNTGQTGWGSHYGAGFSGWNGSSSIHFSSSENRYLPSHGRGMLPGPAVERVAYDKTAWSRGDHPRRSRVDDGLEIHGRIPVNQELRQSSGSRARPSSLEPTHRQRRRGVWGDDAGAPNMWGFGPGSHLSPPGPAREPYGFLPHKTRNAAAVAAAKVESSGLVVAPDGTVIKAGVGAQAPLRGLGGKGRGGGFSSMSDMTPNGVMTGVGNTGLSHSLRIAGDVDLRGRECLAVDSRVAGGIGMGSDAPHFKRVGERFGPSFPPGMGSSMARGASGILGTSNRFRWPREDRSFLSPVEQEDRIFPGKRRSADTSALPQPWKSRLSTPPRSTTSNEVVPDDGAASPPKKSRGSELVDTKLEVEPEVAPPAESESPALQVMPPPPKLPLPPPPPRAQRSPPAGLKRLISKKEDWPRGRERSRDKDREWDRERANSRGHYSPSRRSSPHVIHGSALTDERDRLLLAGIDRNRDQGASASVSTEDVPSFRGRSMEDSHETRRARHYDGRAEDSAVKSRAQSKDSTYRGGDGKESRSETDLKGDKASGNRTPSDPRRDCQKSGVNYRHSSSRDGEDDVAPRRRRPS